LNSEKTGRITAERWQQAKAIVTDALEETSPTARAALVAERCGSDKELLGEVESLLEQTTGPLDDFENASPSLRRKGASLARGLQIGAYEIVRELGRGGMGAVYLARRVDGVFEKEVAIKILKRGTDTDDILGRFSAERQILARLNHPNIARLFDGGTSEDGLPYFVMEYVDGIPITQFAREKNLSLTERLKLFGVVCGAVGYAHQNLVVHRDIKPGNVLVTKDKALSLLDFGIAKLLQDADSEQEAATLTIQRVLTPEYASPEQVKGEPVTTLSDVYSLGVVLYELLTGERPYKFKHRSPDEISRAICEQEPERPSTALTRAFERIDGAEKTGRQLRGDLDNIVLKALRKEPNRRYASVDQFAEDIRRHLEGLPVRARKDTAAYRASKFAQRHKVGVATAVVLALALIGGTIAIAREAQLARQRFNEARELAHSVLFDYHDAIAALPGSTSVRERLVKDALTYLARLSQTAGNDVSLLREIAAAYEKVAAVQGGATVSSRGTALSVSNLGNTQGARENLNKALAIRQKVSRLEPANADARRELAYCFERIGVLYGTTGPPDKAVENLRKAAPLLEALLISKPADEDLQYTLVDNYEGMAKALGNPILPNLGDTKGALDYLSKAQPLIEKLVADHPENLGYRLYLAAHHNAYGWVLGSASGKLSEALEHGEKALAMFQQLTQAEPGNTLYQNQLIQQLSATGRIKLDMGDNNGALELFKRGLAMCEGLLAADPLDAYNRKSTALAYRNVAEASSASGDYATALSNFQKAEQIFSELVKEDPANADSQAKWAYVCLATSRTLGKTGTWNGAIVNADQGIKIAEALLKASPANAAARRTLAQLYFQCGLAHTAIVPSSSSPKDQWMAARQDYQESLALYVDMKSKGTLAATDTNKANELSAEIAKCDAALK
jgi:serine/threonine protein kinase